MPAAFKKKETILLIALILLAIFFRFYLIRNYEVFLGDEGRDMIILRKIFTQRHIPFLGPTASVGGFYLGPIYYWMAAPFLYIWRFDPVGPAYMVAVIGVITVYILYKFLKEAVGFWPAYFTALLYAVCPLIVRYSRSSWNPNPLPLFSLLIFYFIFLALTRKKFIYFLLAGACLGVAVQLHYLAIILAPLATLTVLINAKIKNNIKIIPLAIAGFLITFSPFLLFEIRNNFPNFKTILEFVTRGSTVKYQKLNLPWSIFDLGNIFLSQLSNLQSFLTKIAFMLLSLSGFFFLYKNYKDKQKRLYTSIALMWFIGGLIALRLYTGQIFDYYFGFMFPAPFLLLAILFSMLWNKFYFRITVCLITAIIFVYFLSKGFYLTPPNNQIDQTKNIASFIIEKGESKPFNFALISDHNSDHAYRYFLEIQRRQPTDLEEKITSQLLVVCESKKCEPLGNPTWEIAGFGRAEISGEWNLDKYGFKIFRLIHWPGAPSLEGKPAQKG